MDSRGTWEGLCVRGDGGSDGFKKEDQGVKRREEGRPWGWRSGGKEEPRDILYAADIKPDTGDGDSGWVRAIGQGDIWFLSAQASAVPVKPPSLHLPVNFHLTHLELPPQNQWRSGGSVHR